MEQRITLHFHKLVQRFTRVESHTVTATDFRTLLSALIELFPDLKKQVSATVTGQTNDFLTLITKDRRLIRGEEYLRNQFKEEFIELWVVPSITGSGKAGLIVAGIALVAFALFAFPVLVGATPLATGGLFAGFQGLTGFAAVMGQSILGIGINLILSGLLSFLMPKIDNKQEPERVNNDSFEGLQVTTSINTPVPLHYGLTRFSGHMISGKTQQLNNFTPKNTGYSQRYRFMMATGQVYDADTPDAYTVIASRDGSTWDAFNPITLAYGQGFLTKLSQESPNDVSIRSHDVYFANDVWYHTAGQWTGNWGFGEETRANLVFGAKSVDGGFTWTKINYPFWESMMAYGQSKFIGIGRNPAIGAVTGDFYDNDLDLASSSNGADWTIQPHSVLVPPHFNTYNQEDNAQRLHYWSEKGLWLHQYSPSAADPESDPQHIYWSSNPLSSWNEETTSPSVTVGEWINGLKVFESIALVGVTFYNANPGYPSIWYSTDGKNWQASTNVPKIVFPDGTEAILTNVRDFAKGGSTYACMLEASNSAARRRVAFLKSSDGINWSFAGMYDDDSFTAGFVMNYDQVSQYFYAVVRQSGEAARIIRSKNLASWEMVYRHIGDIYHGRGRLMIRQTPWVQVVTYTVNPYNSPGSDRDHGGGRAGRDTGASA